MKIVLIQPPVRDFYLTAKRTMPYGLAAMAASLVAAGFNVQIIDALARTKNRLCERPPEMNYLSRYYPEPDRSPFALFHGYRHFGLSFRALAERAALAAPFLVGVSSLFTPYAAEALKTAEAVKTMLPECPVVLGGHHPTVMPEAVMACPAVDFVIRGEGEQALPALARALATGGSYRTVPGIVFRKPDGTLCVADPAVVDDPDRLPQPAMDQIDNRFYRRKSGASTVIVASRGCPMHCSYCSMGCDSAPRFRLRAVDAVLTEIRRAVTDRGVRFIDFEDENLSLDRQWFHRLLRAIAQNFAGRDVELRAMNGLFPPTLGNRTVALMQSAGFKTVNLSLGTTAASQLKRFRRPAVGAAFDGALEQIARENMAAVGYIIAAAPFQTAADSLDDLLYLARRRVLAGVSVYYPVPGTLDFERCRTAGVLPRHASLYRSSALPVAHRTSRDETATLMRLGRILNFMKALVDRGEPLPAPEPFGPLPAGMDLCDRHALGRRLLAWFLADGRIRGVTADGRVYAHVSVPWLTERFVAAIGRQPVVGSRSPHAAR